MYLSQVFLTEGSRRRFHRDRRKEDNETLEAEIDWNDATTSHECWLPLENGRSKEQILSTSLWKDSSSDNTMISAQGN